MNITGLSAMHQLMTHQIQSQQTLGKSTSVQHQKNTGFAELFANQIKETNQLQHKA